MPLHPQVRALPDSAVPLTIETLPALRRTTVAATPAEAGRGPELDSVTDLRTNGVGCRLYRPTTGLLPLVVFAHGGGWVDGTLDTHDALCRSLARESGAAVISADYRLAPEHPYPAACADLDAVLDWARGEGHLSDVDGTRIAVAGDSAGGHLAAVAARRSRDRGIALAAQVLFYPVIDPAGTGWGETEHPGLKRAGMRWCWDVFAPDAATTPDLRPLGTELGGLPPTLVITAEYDILTAEAERYAAALAEAGVSSLAVQYRGQIHGFARRIARFDAAPLAIAQAGGFLRNRFADLGD